MASINTEVTALLREYYAVTDHAPNLIRRVGTPQGMAAQMPDLGVAVGLPNVTHPGNTRHPD